MIFLVVPEFVEHDGFEDLPGGSFKGYAALTAGGRVKLADVVRGGPLAQFSVELIELREVGLVLLSV
jgi:hypothetical protein